MRTDRKSVHRYFRQYGKLIVVEHAKALWATDAYLIVPCDPTGPIAALLTYWNLPVAPGNYFVEDSVRPQQDGKQPDVSKFMQPATERLTPLNLLGSAAWKLPMNDSVATIYESESGALIALDDEKRQVVEALSGYGTWHGSDSVSPATYVNDDGGVAGVCMPIRHSLQREVAKPKSTRKAA